MNTSVYATLEQPAPVTTDKSFAVLDYIITGLYMHGGHDLAPDLQARAKLGQARYGTLLMAYNGRNTLVDLYQELLDALFYVTQAILELRGDPVAMHFIMGNTVDSALRVRKLLLQPPHEYSEIVAGQIDTTGHGEDIGVHQPVTVRTDGETHLGLNQEPLAGLDGGNLDKLV